MNDWASRRKNIYLGSVVVLFTAASFFMFYKFWYQAPTCNDNLKNGDETGIDCGGSCSLICSSEAISPIVRWDPRLFEVLSGVWSAVVYVENPNLNADAVVNYKFSIYGQNNELISERSGLTLLPKNKTVGVFEGSIQLGNKRPARAIFEIDKKIIWRKDVKGDSVTITHSPILRAEKSPRVEAEVANNNVDDIENIELVAVVFDTKDNAIAASRTFIEKIRKNEKKEVFFTWPTPFDLGSRVCQKPSNIILAIDRSGSMAAISKNPPEPLTSVKEAASLFVESLYGEDKVGVLSFATSASSPIDSGLSSDIDNTIAAIDSIQILENGTQFTNIYDALRGARQELLSADNSNKVLILLTDGDPTYPRDPEGKTEDDDKLYARKSALLEAQKARQDGINIFTIGLGEEVNEDFLKQLTFSQSNYFKAPTANDLKSIYSSISTAICKETPAYIEITYKILN